jgi:hypothetical protein
MVKAGGCALQLGKTAASCENGSGSLWVLGLGAESEQNPSQYVGVETAKMREHAARLNE